MKFITFFLILLATLTALPTFAEESPSAPAGEEDIYRAFIGPDGVQHIAVTGGNYFFRPNHIIVRVNVPVELEANLERGLVPHTLVIDAPKAGIAVNEKLSTEIKAIHFTPTATGRYPFYCRNKLLFLKSHRDKGMEGVLEVVE